MTHHPNCRLYIYDTEEELKHRKNTLSSTNGIEFDDGLMKDLKEMVDRYNVLAKSFRMARDRLHQGADDMENTVDSMDIVVEERSGRLQRISELHASYLTLQYPILFPRGEDGHRLGKLFQQFVADGCTMIESDRLKYIRFNQPKLRSENFKNLENAAAIGQTNPSSAGVRFIVPSTFKGSKDFMRETYQDTMTICRWSGYPDLFITFTCNPKWPEITRFVQKRGLRPEDRPDILTRVFKLKLDELMRDLKELHMFGRTRAVYKRRENGTTIEKNGKTIHNGYVVPYNADLLLKYRAHINVEWCNQERSIKYLFKYINKGYDRVTDPPVLRLDYHLPNEQNVIFHDDDPIDEVVERSSGGRTKFTAWMEYNNLKSDGRDLTYYEFPQKFVWKKKERVWKPREKRFTLGRMYHMSPNGGERYYLRTLLNFVKGPKSYKDIRTVNGVPHTTFKEACYALGLLGDDKEYNDAIEEASYWGTGFYLRNLFSTLLLTNSLVNPELVWEKTWKITHALSEIESWLQRNGSSLRKFGNMPYPDVDILATCSNRLLDDELSYDKDVLKKEHEVLTFSMTNEQKSIYRKIMFSVENGQGGVYFVYGYGGTGKTFLWKTLCAGIRSKGEIVIAVASSGIAAIISFFPPTPD
ncbi:uncharacterized protein LOC141631751 [Silene latifolia]|uniref:uncharacterized protein LOC141631751 n=1 Tax=Silene latifolia TaxID=37657 RepID=UPI003D782F97